MTKTFNIKVTNTPTSIAPKMQDRITLYMDHIVRVISEHNKNYWAMMEMPLVDVRLIGMVEEYIGHNKVGLINPFDFCQGAPFDMQDGAYPCSVFSYPHNSIMYIWHRVVSGSPKMTGLIADASDTQAISFVERCYGWNTMYTSFKSMTP